MHRKKSQEAAELRGLEQRVCALLPAGAGRHPQFGINVSLKSLKNKLLPIKLELIRESKYM